MHTTQLYRAACSRRRDVAALVMRRFGHARGAASCKGRSAALLLPILPGNAGASGFDRGGSKNVSPAAEGSCAIADGFVSSFFICARWRFFSRKADWALQKQERARCTAAGGTVSDQRRAQQPLASAKSRKLKHAAR